MFLTKITTTLIVLSIASATVAFGDGLEEKKDEKSKKVKTEQEATDILNGKETTTGRGKVKNLEEEAAKADGVKSAGEGFKGGISKKDLKRMGNLDIKDAAAESHARITSRAAVNADIEGIKATSKDLELQMKNLGVDLGVHFENNVAEVAKLSVANAQRFENGVKELIRAEGKKIQGLDSEAKKVLKQYILVRLELAHALKSNLEADLNEMKDEVEIYIIEDAGKLAAVTREERFKAMKNVINIKHRVANSFLNIAGRIEEFAQKEAYKTEIMKLIEENHNLYGGGPDDPTRMTKEEMKQLRDDILKENCV